MVKQPVALPSETSDMRIVCRARHKLRDTSGSSLVLALAFFIVCAIIGTVVLTAASVNTQATVTYQETQQAEYAVTSAADLVGELLVDSVIVWTYDGESDETPDFTDDKAYEGCANELLPHVWRQYGNLIWLERKTSEPFIVPELFTISATGVDAVYAKISFDQDLNMTVMLSLDPDMASLSSYNEQVSFQVTPHFDVRGKLVSVSWDSYTVTKAASAVDPSAGGESR